MLYFPFPLNASLLSEQELSELGEKAVSDFLNVESFLIVDSGLILVLESFRLDLNNVGVGLTGPEPLCTPELNILGISRGDGSQSSEQLSAFGAVLDTESDIGYTIRDDGSAIRNGQRLSTVAILLIRMYEVSVATLKSEATADILEAPHYIHDGNINCVNIQRGQGCMPLLDVMRVIDKALGFRERFHLLRFLLQSNNVFMVSV